MQALSFAMWSSRTLSTKSHEEITLCGNFLSSNALLFRRTRAHEAAPRARPIVRTDFLSGSIRAREKVPNLLYSDNTAPLCAIHA